MLLRGAIAIAGLIGVTLFGLIRPEFPTAGSDCEVLATGLLREPLAAISSGAIIAAGWLIARHRAMPGVAVLVAGMASFAAHASAHPTARALDGIVAGIALVAVAGSIVRDRPDAHRLATGLTIGSVAITVWILTRTDGVLCDAAGAWGHASWHVLVAAAVVIAAAPETEG